ncbi:Toprim domain-containing protein [Alkalibaculum bacchi]|uniref:Toprim domain-containing protein n=1 Tax=Alkalibaculum bacchi TaxID=645887 RepID=A0A366I024_9FIRM|nr:DUF3991 domain-containing protein [Alkalibaculum bacchi]RBP59320.1 Toprim domain-containing protein [Alkalibaculum bacchi]
MGKIYSQKEINQAQLIDIVDYCLRNNIGIIKNSERYYRLVDHDSCVIDKKNNLFYWNSRSIGGNVINFIQEFEGVSFREAMQRLIGGAKEGIDLSNNINYKLHIKEKFTAKSFVYAKDKEVSSFYKARNYLINERKIDPKIVDDLHQEGLIKQDKYNNVLFLWKDNKKIVGCSEQGTIKSDKLKRGYWKSIQENSISDHGFNILIGKPKNLKFFESSIDLLSYATLNKKSLKDVHLISMEGLKYGVILNYIDKTEKLLDKGNINISLCVDNDIAAMNFIIHTIEILKEKKANYNIITEIPLNSTLAQKWDWNDQLKFFNKY